MPIGFSPEGARYAGIPVARRIRLVYLLCGLAAGMSSIVYVSHLGQAKSDAGTGYELFAITAVVLGGTSIFGGAGSVHGTLLGVAAIAVLKNGLACLPAVMRLNAAEEMSGLLTGASNRLLIGRPCQTLRVRIPSAPHSRQASGP